MDLFKLASINNIINKMLKKSIDIFRNIKGFCKRQNIKNLKNTKQFFWVIKVSLAWKTKNSREKTALFFLNIKTSCAGLINKVSKETKQLFWAMKVSLVWKTKNSRERIWRFFRNIRGFCAGLINKLSNSGKQLFGNMKNSFVRLIKRIPEKMSYFFLSIKVLFAGLHLKTPDGIKHFFRGVARYTKHIFLSVTGFCGRHAKKIQENTKQFFRVINDFTSRQTIQVDLLLILAVLLLIINPLVINSFSSISRSEIGSKQVNLFLSMRCEELLGSEITAMLLQEFNKQNPNIQLVLHKELDGEEESAPDILIFDESEFNRLIAANMLADLSSYYSLEDTHLTETQDNQIDDSRLPDVTSQAFQFEFPFAVPLVSFMDVLFYNIEILSAAGFDHPPKTRDEFITAARAVSRGNFPGISGAVLSLSSDDSQALSRDIFSWMWAAGVNFWPEGERPVLTSPSNARALTGDITFFGNLYREVQTHGIFEYTGNKRIEEFAQGKVALMIASTSSIPYLREQMGDNVFGITTIPASAAGGRYGVSLSSIYAGINSGSPHTDDETLRAMIRFLKFLTENTALFCAELKAIPGSVINPIPGDYVRNDSFYSKAWDIFEAARIVQGFSGKPGAEKYEAVFLEELKTFFEGGRTALQAVTAIQRRWDEVEAGY